MAIPELSETPLSELISLRGRRAVVTGGAAGLGRAIASRLAEAGADILIGDLDDRAAATAAAEIAQAHRRTVLGVNLDVADSASVAALADLAVTNLGGIDIWINNAGIYPSKPLVELTDEAWDRILDVNLRGAFVGCREAARRMGADGRGGVIVNLASVAGLRGRAPNVTAYSTSKHGVVGLTQQVALELAPRRIRVLAIAPDIIITPGVAATRPAGTDLEEALRSQLGRAGRPDDVARVALFCVSDLSMFMTGSTLLVDAGSMAR